MPQSPKKAWETRVYSSTRRRIRAAVPERDKGLCQIKGPKCKIYATEVDHIVDVWLGGGVAAACDASRYPMPHTPGRGDGGNGTRRIFTLTMVTASGDTITGLYIPGTSARWA